MLSNQTTILYYRPQQSCGQGNVFTGVCLSTGGRGCLPQCMLGCHIPPDLAVTPPWGPGRHPPRTRQTPPGTWQTPPSPGTWQTPPSLGPGRHPPSPSPRDLADTPLPFPPGCGRPPGTRQTPPQMLTPTYGPRAAGTHPTGMHSCSLLISLFKRVRISKTYGNHRFPVKGKLTTGR